MTLQGMIRESAITQLHSTNTRLFSILISGYTCLSGSDFPTSWLTR